MRGIGERPPNFEPGNITPLPCGIENWDISGGN